MRPEDVQDEPIQEEPIQEEPVREETEEPKETERLYVGSKLILASEMDEITFSGTVKKAAVPSGQENRPGYKVTYPDGYVSWSPKETFETAYREVTLREKALF